MRSIGANNRIAVVAREHLAFIGEAKSRTQASDPSNPTEQITLLGKISAKHFALGASSVLASFKWIEIGTSLTDAEAHDEEAAKLPKQAKQGYRVRAAAMAGVIQALRDARDLLLVANRDNPKALGDFGYADDDSPQAKAKAKPAS
jgi:hypothetical protein